MPVSESYSQQIQFLAYVCTDIPNIRLHACIRRTALEVKVTVRYG